MLHDSPAHGLKHGLFLPHPSLRILTRLNYG
jgi:hypothetical protein